MIDLGNGVQMVTRFEWGARTPTSRTSASFTFGITSHWEGPPMGDFPHSSCPSKVRGIQNYHMDSQGWTDIAYSALSCPHGYVFEGRGPNIRTAANGTTQGNDTAGAVCYLGGEGDPFTDAAKQAHRAACDWLDEHGAASGRNCHRDWKNTACPGDTICSWVKAGLPVPTTPPSEDEFLASLTETQQTNLYNRLIRIEKALAVVMAGGDYLGTDLSTDDIKDDIYATYLGTLGDGVQDGVVKGGVAESSVRKRAEDGFAQWISRSENQALLRQILGVSEPTG